jgi:NADPH-dependent 2,4-dienoyl-CoA reductase/sulfur reductase-like enzyme/rhodanese-related sulfurtransferase
MKKDLKGRNMNPNNKKIVVVGGVAGGASCAARARRLSEDAQIIVFERGPYVSFANCGLPYYVGKVIPKEESLLVATPKMFKEWFNIEVRNDSEVVAIDPAARWVDVRNHQSGQTYRETYDDLVIAPGATPLKPPISGCDLEGLFTLRNIPDTRAIVSWINAKNVHRAAVVGGGFVGLEMAENLNGLGIDVSIIERLPQVMPSIDGEMAELVHAHIKTKGIALYLNREVTGFIKTEPNGAIQVNLDSKDQLSVDMVILSVGVRPEVNLARNAGLAIGELGGILVNEYMQTSDRHIYAVGDAVEVKNYQFRVQQLVPLAGPANRQGRLAAETILVSHSKRRKFRGVQGTAVCGVMGLTVASTGAGEKALKALAQKGQVVEFEKVYLHPDHHSGYYPDAKMMTIKLMFAKQDGKILGAQAVGTEGVDKRIDVIAMAIQMGATVFDLEEAELCYAPQYGAAKDAVNLIGMAAANVLRGDVRLGHWENLDSAKTFVLDVRDSIDSGAPQVPHAVHIPLEALRERLNELPKDRKLWVHCYMGKRSYFACRILTQKGFDACSVSGGILLYDPVKRAAKMQ